MIGISGRFFQLGQLKNVAVELAAFFRLDAAQAEVADAAFALLDLVRVDVAAVFHVRLGQIENVAHRVVHADAGEGAVARPMEHLDFGILFFESGKHDLNLLHFEPEVIETRLAPWRARVEIQSDVAVTDDHCAACTLQTRTAHAEYVPIKIAFVIRVAGHDRHMAHLCKHGRPPLGCRDYHKVVECSVHCQWRL